MREVEAGTELDIKGSSPASQSVPLKGSYHDDDAYILKAKKFGEPLFQSKKIAEKVRKSGRHFWAIWGNCGPFWVIFGPLWIILGHSRAILGHLGSYLGHFGPKKYFDAKFYI